MRMATGQQAKSAAAFRGGISDWRRTIFVRSQTLPASARIAGMRKMKGNATAKGKPRVSRRASQAQ